MTEGSQPISGSCYYRPLVALTDQDEVAVLHDVMLRALRELFPGSSIGLYVLCEKESEWQRVAAVEGDDEEGAIASALMASLQDLRQHVAGGEEHLLESAGNYTCLPIYHGHLLQACVVLTRSLNSIAPQGYLAALLKIYGNQMVILKRSKQDALTGLFNRQTFDEKVPRIFPVGPDHRRNHLPVKRGWCLALLDIDRFKRINDSFGHLYGDEVLLLFARIMSEAFREQDLLFRYGGEEFVVLLHDVDQATALQVLERFRQRVEDYVFPQVGQVTVSVGFTLPGQALPVAAIVSQADKALYHAKDHGRNQVKSYQQLLQQGMVGEPDTAVADIELF